MIDLEVSGTTARFAGYSCRCAIGRGGASRAKYEGDGATPVGRLPCRWLYWRADRVSEPVSRLARRPLRANDGWCDDPASPRYNRFVTLPVAERHEMMWRADALYDLVVVLGYNERPAVPGRGSAIFLHVATPDYRPTEGCIALALPDLQRFLALTELGSAVIVEG